MRTIRLALAVLAVAAVVPMAVIAQIPKPTPLSPKNKAVLPVGKTPTFKVRSTGEGTVWIHISKSARKTREGVIKNDAHIGQAKKRGTTFTHKPKFFNYPTFWANTSRKWYWQAYRIACGEQSDCKVEGPVRSFTLR
jgi:hypothetical protein